MLKKSHNTPVVFLLLLFGSLIAAIAFVISFRKNRSNPEKRIRETLSKSAMPFAPAQIELWVAVSKLETDNFKSVLCNSYFNLFGMTVPTKRDSLRDGQVFMIGDDQYFSTYSNFVWSVRDLIVWAVYANFDRTIGTLDAFVSEMKRVGYFTASSENYKERLKDFL